MKTKELKQYNLPSDRILVGSIEAKPYFLIFLALIIGFVLVFFFNRMYGISLIFMGFGCLAFLPRRELMEFTTDYVILFNKANQSNCILIYYEDIESWSYINGFLEDEVVIELVDGSTQRIECFSKNKIERLLGLYAKGKQKQVRKKK